MIFMKNNFFSILFGVAVFFLIITLSIALPIYLRFFYYLQINALGLPESTGYDYQTIKSAYDEVLNYLTLPFCSFGTGVFSHTAEGASHFADCKALFTLNLSALLASVTVIIVTLILNKKKIISLAKPKGLGITFYSAVSVLILFVVLALVVCIDFNQAFIVFHKLFFAGKDNWTFNPRYDQIITILPQQFFMNCAIFIICGIVVFSSSLITFNLAKRAKSIKCDKNQQKLLTYPLK